MEEEEEEEECYYGTENLINDQRKCIHNLIGRNVMDSGLLVVRIGKGEGIFLRCALVWTVFGLRLLLPRSEM